MNAIEDLTPAITVDWESVEEDIGRVIGPGLRRIVEHEPSESDVQTALLIEDHRLERGGRR